MLFLLDVVLAVLGDLVQPRSDHGDPSGQIMADGYLPGAGGEEVEPLAPHGQLALYVDAEHELVQHVLHLQRHVPGLLHPHIHVRVAALAALVVRHLDERLEPLELVLEQHDLVANLLELGGLLHHELA